MLRECRRVLRPGGRLAVLTIELGVDLDDESKEQARILGPERVAAPAPAADMVARAGLLVEQVVDVSEEHLASVRDRIESLARHEEALRAAEGDQAVDEERRKRERMREAIERGLIRRTFVLARREDEPVGPR